MNIVASTRLGVVRVPSAFAWYHDRVRSSSLHTDMTGSAEGLFRAPEAGPDSRWAVTSHHAPLPVPR